MIQQFQHHDTFKLTWSVVTSGYTSPGKVEKLADRTRSDQIAGQAIGTLTPADGIEFCAGGGHEQPYNCVAIQPALTIGGAASVEIKPLVKNPNSSAFVPLGVGTNSSGVRTFNVLVLKITSDIEPEPIMIPESILLLQAKATGDPATTTLVLYLTLGRI